MKLVEVAVDLLEEDEGVEPLQHVLLADLDPHVARARSNDELEVELLVRVLLRELDGDEAAAGKEVRLAREVGGARSGSHFPCA